jgi:hypothetical protein
MSDMIQWCEKCNVRPAKRLACGIPVYLPCDVCLRETTTKIALSLVAGEDAEVNSMRVNQLLGRDNE